MSTADHIPHFTLRWCSTCGECLKDELGSLCKGCLETHPPVPLAFVNATLASCLVDLNKLEDRGMPMAQPLRDALVNIRKAYDGLQPILQAAAEGSLDAG